MGYQVLARKWRPHQFKEMVGQQHVVRALVNGLEKNRLHHAYLFTGTRGVGKTTLARILAKSLNCENGVTAEPCGTCQPCVALNEGRFIDLIEVDAASRTKVEDTRELLENVHFSPTIGRFKVYLIDEVHMLSTHSFNALLKTLEEPPEHVKFLLATTDPQKLPITVLSRCLQFNLKRLMPEQIEPQLEYVLAQEHIAFQASALQRIAAAADGSMRDALSLLDQAIAYGTGDVNEADVCDMLGAIDQQQVEQLLLALFQQDAAGIMLVVQALFEQAADFEGVLQALLTWLHHLAVVQMIPNIDDARFEQAFFREQADAVSVEDVQLYYQIGLLGQKDLLLSPDPRVGFEMVMLRMLAFRPDDSQPSTPQSAATSPAHPPALPQPPLSAPPRAVPSTTPAPARAAPTRVAPAPTPDVAKVAPAGASANIEQVAQDWHAVVKQLSLKAMAKELANNCVFERWEGSTLHLTIESEREHLLTNLLQERFKSGLEAYLGQSIVLKIRVDSAQTETPAQKKQREQVENHADALKSIEDDPHVQAMKSVFGAEIVPNSVRPIVDDETDGTTKDGQKTQE